MPRSNPPRRGGAARRRSGAPRASATSRSSAKPASGKKSAPADRTPTTTPSPAGAAPPPPFRLGAVAGTTPGTWIDRWNARRAQARRGPLDLVPLEAADQRSALETDAVDAALVRLPIDRDGLHLIPLYDEQPVVVMSTESALTVADELEPADLDGEVLIVPVDDVLRMPPPEGTETPAFAAPKTTEDAIATVATGVGIVVVPMSLARLHHRRDVTFRPLRGGPVSSVALAWVVENTSDDIEAFVGIVRGRTENSSR